jgi:hypothetical protein
MSGFVQGLTSDNAKALLAIADDLGLDPAVVATADDGFNVPDEVHDAFVKSLGGDDDDEKKKAPAKKAASKETS